MKSLIAVFYVTFATLLSVSDWPRFRGPDGAGVSADRGLPAEIDREKNVVWSARTPKGNSSPIIVGGLIKYDRDGKELWRTLLGPFSSVQGLAASPLYVEGKVILLVDTPEEAYLAAFDAETGKQAWKAERPTGVLGSYATPTLFTRDGEPAQVIVAGAMELTGYRAKTGERLWWARGVTAFPTAPPFVAGDSVYTVEPVEAGWPPFNYPLKLFDKNSDGRIEIAEAASDPMWAGSLKGIDKNVGNGDNVVTEDEYSKAATGGNSGGLIRTRVGGKGDVSDSHILWRNTKGAPVPGCRH
jgi:outer membrane protein assembly factor BamB